MTSLAQAPPPPPMSDSSSGPYQPAADTHDVPYAPPLPDSTAEMPPVPEPSNQVMAGASLRSLAQRFGDRPRLDDDESGRRRAIVTLAVAGAAAVAIVLTVVIISMTQGSGGDGADPAQDDEVAAPVALGGLATITAPATAPDSVDWAGNPVSYGTDNLTDGEPATAWRMEGDGSGIELTISWDAPRTITEVGMINGYAKVDPERENYNWYDINRRVTQATWIFDDGTEVTHQLSQTAELQTMKLESPVETSSLRLRLDEVSAPGGRDYTALSEIAISGR